MVLVAVNDKVAARVECDGQVWQADQTVDDLREGIFQVNAWKKGLWLYMLLCSTKNAEDTKHATDSDVIGKPVLLYVLDWLEK